MISGHWGDVFCWREYVSFFRCQHHGCVFFFLLPIQLGSYADSGMQCHNVGHVVVGKVLFGWIKKWGSNVHALQHVVSSVLIDERVI